MMMLSGAAAGTGTVGSAAGGNSGLPTGERSLFGTSGGAGHAATSRITPGGDGKSPVFSLIPPPAHTVNKEESGASPSSISGRHFQPTPPAISEEDIRKSLIVEAKRRKY